MTEYRIKLTQTFEAVVDGPTEEIAQENFNELMHTFIEPAEKWEITQITFSDE